MILSRNKRYGIHMEMDPYTSYNIGDHIIQDVFGESKCTIYTKNRWFIANLFDGPLHNKLIYYVVEYDKTKIRQRFKHYILVDKCKVVNKSHKIEHAITFYEELSGDDYNGPYAVNCKNIKDDIRPHIQFNTCASKKQECTTTAIQYGTHFTEQISNGDYSIQYSNAYSTQSASRHCIQYSKDKSYQYSGHSSIQYAGFGARQVSQTNSLMVAGNNSIQYAKEKSISIIYGLCGYCQHTGHVIQIMYYDSKFYIEDRIWDGNLYKLELMANNKMNITNLNISNNKNTYSRY